MYETIDWEFFHDYAEKNPPFQQEFLGSAYRTLVALTAQHRIRKQATKASKKWWDDELSQALRNVSRARRIGPNQGKAESKAFKKLVKEKKKSCWNKFVEEQGHRHHWDVHRIANDPFHLKSVMGELKDAQGQTLTTDQDKLEAFRQHHIITNPDLRSPPIAYPPTPHFQAETAASRRS